MSRELRAAVVSSPATGEARQAGAGSGGRGCRRPTRWRPGPRLGVRCFLAAVTGGLAAAGVYEAPGRDSRQPRARVARRVLGPHPQRLQTSSTGRCCRSCASTLTGPDPRRSA
jgi:hypothetical protein